MQIDRRVAHAPRTSELSRDIAHLKGPCIGCADCRGLCMALIELISVPGAVLGKGQL